MNKITQESVPSKESHESVVQTTYKQTELGLIPCDWELVELGSISNISSGGTPNRGIAAYWNGGIPWVTTSQIDFNTINQSFEFITEEGLNNSAAKIYKKGTLLMAMYGQGKTRGKVAILGIDATTNQACAAIYVNKNILKEYVFCNLSGRYDEIRNLSNTGNQENLSGELIKKILIPLPPTKAEQTAIATALSDADALISSLEKFIAKKRMIKQGAMQQLLSESGFTRLKDKLDLENQTTHPENLANSKNPDSDKWEVKKLGEIAEIKKGQLITESTRINGSIPVIAGGKTPSYYHNKPNRYGKTITISASGASAGYVLFHNYPIFASDCSTIEENENYSIEFLFFLLQLIQEKIYKMQTGGAQPHIHPSDLNPIVISIPTKEEQTRIATILSDMDAEIAALETKLEKYRKVKLGMMQNLLTGKIRLV